MPEKGEAPMNPDIVMMVTVTGMVSWIAWVIFSNLRRYKIARYQAEVHTKLLEKFGRSEELLAYLESEAGKRFLESASIEQAKPNPFARILWAVQAGLILTLAGVALLFLRSRVPDIAEGFFLVLGALAVAIGVGFVLAAGASYGLSRSFGLIPGAATRRP
jgi:hypothetical protein